MSENVLDKFSEKCIELLIHNNNVISLDKFAEAFQKRFSTPCRSVTKVHLAILEKLYQVIANK